MSNETNSEIINSILLILNNHIIKPLNDLGYEGEDSIAFYSQTNDSEFNIIIIELDSILKNSDFSHLIGENNDLALSGNIENLYIYNKDQPLLLDKESLIKFFNILEKYAQTLGEYSEEVEYNKKASEIIKNVEKDSLKEAIQRLELALNSVEKAKSISK